MLEKNFWCGKKVFLTGHTGFKGSWLCLWLHYLGAKVTGYALSPPTKPNLFELCQAEQFITSIIADIKDREKLQKAMLAAEPEIIIHMAAQPLVREAYLNPVETYATNIMGTVHLLEAVRVCKSVKAVVNVTTDKCYENMEWVWGYRENDALGGYDPYSASKACSELVTSSYRNSYFNPREYQVHGVGIASARAGNVIGGGDWAKDRLIPDCIRALTKGEKIIIRNPKAVRPWQHVLEPLGGYLLLAQKLYQASPQYTGAWNFGPNDDDAQTVEWIVKQIYTKLGQKNILETNEQLCTFDITQGESPHEANYLKLDCSKAKSELGWSTKWNLEQALDKVIEWLEAYQENQDIKEVCFQQIGAFSS